MLAGGNEGDKLSERKVYSRRSFKGLETGGEQLPEVPTMVSEAANSLKRTHSNSGFDVGSDNFSGLMFPMQENQVRINLSKKSKPEALELKRKLESERDLVRSLMRRIEANDRKKDLGIEQHISNQLNPVANENNSIGIDNVEKEKRTPKANKFYRNSEFLLAKDRIPENNKKLKPNGKKGGGIGGLPQPPPPKKDKFPNNVLKSCNALLERLMKHKHGWVFNKPVDAVALGLHDYFEIIKNPMDLGTVKDRLAQNLYKSPMEFADDVRLTFQNAMTYNPKGQDVHAMAEQLSKLFEEKWGQVEADYIRGLKHSGDLDLGLPSPPSRKAPAQSRSLSDTKKNVDRSDSNAPKKKAVNAAQSGKVPIQKKPKAKDPNKREMTYDEKQKLSINLQSLPSEKLENVVQIIKKRNPSVSQQDDEIEVDIDVVDTETLWELDRFIINYKKSLSKTKRRAEIGSQLMSDQERIAKEMVTTPIATEMPKANRIEEDKTISIPVEVEERGTGNADDKASQSSSSSDSGSSSSDSDGDSSSADGSVDANSPKN